MDSNDKLTISGTVNTILRVPCGTCLVHTNHKVLASVEVEGQAEDFDYFFRNEFQIIQCMGCTLISLRKSHSDNIDQEVTENPDGTIDETPIITEELYPIRIAGRSRLKNAHMIPQPVRRIYEEVHIALGNRLPILASVGIRTLIESICHDKSAKGNNLKERIDSLVALSVLTTQGAEILHLLRDLGNDSVHEFKGLDQPALEGCLDVIESVIQNVYIIPKLSADIAKKTK